MNLFCPLVASLVEKIDFSSNQKFCKFQRICHIYLSNWALCTVKQKILIYEKLMIHVTRWKSKLLILDHGENEIGQYCAVDKPGSKNFL